MMSTTGNVANGGFIGRILKTTTIKKRKSSSDSGDLCIELNQRNTELERQNNKLLADQRETTSQLNYKDDKIQFLERRNDALEQQLRSITLAMDLKIDDYRQVIQLQAEELEKTKDVLKTKTNRLSVVEKELVALKKQNEDAAAEFDKAYAEATWNQNALLAAKREHQKKEQAAKRQRKLDAERIAQLEHENRQLHSDLEGISDYCTKLEQEKTDLQDELAQSTVNDNATHSLLHQLEVDDCEGDQTLDTETLLTNAFRPVESEMSLFSELQSCLGSQFTPVAEVSTQTEELTPQVFHTWESPICSKIEVEEAPQKLQLSTKATQTQAEITAYTKATQTQDEITANCSPVLLNGECSVPVPKKQYTSPSVRDGKQLNRVSSPPLDIRRRRPSIPNSKPVTSADSRKHLILQYGDWILSGACWPWDGTTTWNGLMRGLTIILMLLGFLIATKVISVPSCGLSVRTLFGLSHKTPPRI